MKKKCDRGCVRLQDQGGQSPCLLPPTVRFVDLPPIHPHQTDPSMHNRYTTVGEKSARGDIIGLGQGGSPGPCPVHYGC